MKKDDLFPDSVVAPLHAAIDAFSPALGQKARDVFNAGFDTAVAASRKDGFKAGRDNVTPPDSCWRPEQVPAGTATGKVKTPAL